MGGRLCTSSALPLGIKFLHFLRKKEIAYASYQTSVFTLTFVAYALYHLSRKPISIAKSTLASDVVLVHRQSPLNLNRGDPIPWPVHKMYRRQAPPLPISAENASAILHNGTVSAMPRIGWAPFDGDDGTALLADIDVAFLAVYALGTFFSGHIGDRVSLRWFLMVGMVGSGISTCLFGMAYWWNVHWLPYFFIIQMISGLFQSTGLPSVVAVVGNWSGKKRRGLIMGVWNAHTSIGNICGSLIASSLLDHGWGWAFVVPGFAVLAGATLIFLFLLEHPSVVGLPLPYEGQEAPHTQQQAMEDEESGQCKQRCGVIEGEKRGCKMKENEKAIPLLLGYDWGNSSDKLEISGVKAIGCFQALAIPGVISFALCLFFAKLVAYTILYWLPYYIQDIEIGGVYLSDESAGNISTLFDVGGALGGILAGYLSDKLNARATTAASFAYCAIPAIAFYRVYGGSSLWMNVSLLIVSGALVNGPYSLITTAVSADLGTHESVKGNARALATVTAIIDGTGSIGAALGPLITGYISEATGWDAVFLMLTLSSFMSGFLLTTQVVSEHKTRTRRR